MNFFNTVLIQPLTNGLILFYNILGSNLGLAIIGFSVFLRLILSPLTKPYMESMKKIKEIEPLVTKLKKKYTTDKMGFAKAQSELYKQKGINPGAGCLPYLLQIVVLIAFFNVFSTALSGGSDVTQKLNGLLYPALQFGSEQAINTKFLYLDLAKPDTFKLAFIPFALPGPILFLAALTQFLSAKMMAPYIEEESKLVKKTEGKEDDMQVAMQKSTTYTFPLLTLVFGLQFSSGLALYWLVFSAFQLVQQYKSSGLGGLTGYWKKAKKLAGLPSI